MQEKILISSFLQFENIGIQRKKRAIDIIKEKISELCHN